MSVLRAASVAQDEGISKTAVVAAIFELADHGTINMSYREGELTLSQRSAANYQLPPELHLLRSAIFGNKETVVLRRDETMLDGVKLSSLNKIVTREVADASEPRAMRQIHSAEGRLVATWLAIINLLVMAIFAVALSPAGLIVAFIAMSIPTVMILRRLYHRTVQLHDDNPFIQRDDDQIGFVILAASLVSDNHRDVERAIATWVLSENRRRPSWWYTNQPWPQDDSHNLFAAWSILWSALR